MEQTHTGLRDGTNRNLTIEYGTTMANTEWWSTAVFVDRMFDEHGAETTDPVAAVEVERDGELIKVEAGGWFRVLVRVESNSI